MIAGVLCKEKADGKPVLLTAAGRGDFYFVHLLLNAFANPDASGYGQRTAVHLAVLADSAMTLQHLILHNAHVQIQDMHGESPSHDAGAADNFDLVKVLLSAGANALPQTYTMRPPYLLFVMQATGRC